MTFVKIVYILFRHYSCILQVDSKSPLYPRKYLITGLIEVERQCLMFFAEHVYFNHLLHITGALAEHEASK